MLLFIDIDIEEGMWCIQWGEKVQIILHIGCMSNLGV